MDKQLKEDIINMCNEFVEGRTKPTKDMYERIFPTLIKVLENDDDKTCQPIFGPHGTGYKCPVCNNEEVELRHKYCSSCGRKFIFESFPSDRDLDSAGKKLVQETYNQLHDKASISDICRVIFFIANSSEYQYAGRLNKEIIAETFKNIVH